MTSYLLDTNHASPLVTPGHPLRGKILENLRKGDIFYLCVPVITETLFGIIQLPRARQNREEWHRLQPLIPCHIPDKDDAETAAELQHLLRKRGHQLSTVDALIAVLALRHNCILLSTDRDFEGIPELIRENWL